MMLFDPFTRQFHCFAISLNFFDAENTCLSQSRSLTSFENNCFSSFPLAGANGTSVFCYVAKYCIVCESPPTTFSDVFVAEIPSL